MTPSRAASELLCQRCDRDYDVWSAPNELWNRVAADWNFLCFDCFIALYRKDAST
jgi:hypothetical protein